MSQFPLCALLTVVLTPAHLGTALLANKGTDCSSADSVLEEGNITVIFNNVSVQENHSEIVKKNIYAKFEKDFEGVSLMAQGIGKNDQSSAEHCRQKTWFSMDEHCFTQSTWYEIKVKVELKPSKSLDFYVMCGDCIWGCQIHNTFTAFESVTLTAHGPSKWTSNASLRDSCSVKLFEGTPKKKIINCTEPSQAICTVPTPEAPLISLPQDRPLSSFLPIEFLVPVIAVVIVIVIVVVIVVVTLQMKQRRLTGSDSVMGQAQAVGETQNRENSLYEPCDNYTTGAAAAEGKHSLNYTNSLYEPLENHSGRF